MVKRILQKIADVMSYIAMIAVLAMVALNGYEIFTRFLLEKSNYWIQDVTTLLMVWFVFPGMVKVIWEKKDILIDIVPRELPHKGRRILFGFVHIVVILFTSAMCYATLQYFLLVRDAKSIIAHIPMPFFTIMILIGWLLFLIIYIYDFIALLKNKEEDGSLGGRSE